MHDQVEPHAVDAFPFGAVAAVIRVLEGGVDCVAAGFVQMQRRQGVADSRQRTKPVRGRAALGEHAAIGIETDQRAVRLHASRSLDGFAFTTGQCV
jgi:hypothetical protein